MHQLLVEIRIFIGVCVCACTPVLTENLCDVIRLAEDPFQSLEECTGKARGCGTVWGKLSQGLSPGYLVRGLFAKRKRGWPPGHSLLSIWCHQRLQRRSLSGIRVILEVTEPCRSPQRPEEPQLGFPHSVPAASAPQRAWCL